MDAPIPENPKTPTRRGRLRRWTRDVAEAIRGSEQDFTTGSIGRAIVLLSIPMVLEMFMESVFAVVDIFFVSRLGSEAVATVGVTESILTLVYAVAIGMSMATTAMVSRRIGEKRPADAAVAAVQAIAVGIVSSFPIAIAGIFFAPQLLGLMGMSDVHSGFTTVLLGTNVVVMLIFIINAVFRGAGDAAVAMRVLWIANGINLVLDPCLIFGLGPFPELGVTGAAVATTIGRSIGVAYQFRKLSRSGGRIRILANQLTIVPSVMARLMRVSLGGIGQFIIATSSWIGVMRVMAHFGSDSLAGYTIAIRILIFTLLPSWGISNAAATLVGQNLGAGQPDRAARSVWLSAFGNMAFLGLVAVVFITSGDSLMRIFTTEPNVVAVGARGLRIMSYGYILYALGSVMIQSFNGAGDTTTPTIINFFCFWMMELPLAYALAIRFDFGENGVYWAIMISESVMAVVATVLFRRGRWKTREV